MIETVQSAINFIRRVKGRHAGIQLHANLPKSIILPFFSASWEFPQFIPISWVCVLDNISVSNQHISMYTRTSQIRTHRLIPRNEKTETEEEGDNSQQTTEKR